MPAEPRPAALQSWETGCLSSTGTQGRFKVKFKPISAWLMTSAAIVRMKMAGCHEHHKLWGRRPPLSLGLSPTPTPQPWRPPNPAPAQPPRVSVWPGLSPERERAGLGGLSVQAASLISSFDNFCPSVHTQEPSSAAASLPEAEPSPCN